MNIEQTSGSIFTSKVRKYFTYKVSSLKLRSHYVSHLYIHINDNGNGSFIDLV